MLIKEKEFNTLIEHTDKFCVSMFIPTARAGKDVLEEKNRTHLKSEWDTVKKELNQQDIDQAHLDKLDQKVNGILQDSNFWRNQSDGLAVFVAEDFFEYYSVPVNFAAYHYIGQSFYIKPLLPIYTDDEKFYILSLQIEDVKLYEATKYTIAEVDIEDLTPTRLEERVGYDYKEKALQFRTQNEDGAKTQFHGHGGSERDEKNEILLFFRAVNKGLQSFFNNKKDPLVVACQDYLFPIYEEANTYKELFDKPVPGNPNDGSALDLHEKAVDLLEGFIGKNEQAKINDFKETTPEKKSSIVHDIIPAAYEGKIDTLFLENRAELWGKYDEKTREVTVDDQRDAKSISLMNLAAKKTIETGGKLFLVEAQFMPEKEAKLNAIYRY